MELINAKAWLLHWSLFLFYKREEKAGLFLQLAFEPAYDQVMQLVCRHLFRYLFASSVLCKEKDVLPVLGDFMSEAEHKYADDFTNYVKILTQTFEFERIPEALEKIKKVTTLYSESSYAKMISF